MSVVVLNTRQTGDVELPCPSGHYITGYCLTDMTSSDVGCGITEPMFPNPYPNDFLYTTDSEASPVHHGGYHGIIACSPLDSEVMKGAGSSKVVSGSYGSVLSCPNGVITSITNSPGKVTLNCLTLPERPWDTNDNTTAGEFGRVDTTGEVNKMTCPTDSFMSQICTPRKGDCHQLQCHTPKLPEYKVITKGSKNLRTD